VAFHQLDKLLSLIEKLNHMKTSLFISYAWTSNPHREWVRMLANQLRLLGYTVKIDEAAEYGSNLNSFMREVTEADHVLLIADENYAKRADELPDSGVGIENQWIRNVFNQKPVGWLSVLFVNNPQLRLPTWLVDERPKGFNFNSNPDRSDFPGVEQMDHLWRWVEGLPADKAHALSASALLERISRIERIDAMGDPSNYANPALKDRVTFRHSDHNGYKLGHGEYAFTISFSNHGNNSVFVYRENDLKAVGLITGTDFDQDTVENFLSPGRNVTPCVGQSVVVMNSFGALCIIKIEGVQRETNAGAYVPGEVTFRYEILVGR